MSGAFPTPWPNTADDRLADDRHQGHMARWADGSATVATFAHSGSGRQRRIYVPNADADSAGALTAAGFATLALLDGVGQPDVPSCLVYHSVAQSIANSSLVTPAFDSEAYDTHGFHDTATNNGRLTIPSGLDGLYVATAQLLFAASAAAARYSLAITLNGTTNVIARSEHVSAAVNHNPSLNATSTPRRLVATDNVRIVLLQATGGALDLTGGEFGTAFGLERRGDF